VVCATIDLEVSDLGVPGTHRVSAWVFSPEVVGERTPLLFCVPGGSYTKAYWHLKVPGRSGYSFGEYFAAKGMLVVAVDNLGTGESSRNLRIVDLTPEVVAAANESALSQVVRRAAEGSLVPGLAPLNLGPVVGVGHSMGAMLVIFQQSLRQSFDAIAPLGYGTVGPIGRFAEGPLPTLEDVFAAARAEHLDEFPVPDRSTMRHHFYWDDVPDDVIAADDQTVTVVPGVCGTACIVPYIASSHAARIESPVFIGLGERDSTRDHRDEPTGYLSSSDITLYVLPSSAHCHNTASTRHLLWDRLDRWIGALDTETQALHGRRR
jgi:pimeloyl-ACP methyl ester carboxylesterase